MYIPIYDLLFILLLSVFLIVVYRRIIYSIDFLEPVQQRYSALDRKLRVNNYIKNVTRKPQDMQKIIFKEVAILTGVIFIMFLLATKAVFFTAVASGSMSPTFERDDLVLMQNIDRTYRPGDIIMFNRPDTSHPVSHRIASITDQGISTEGDAIGQIDWWRLEEKDIMGKAVLIRGKPIVIKQYGKFFIVDDRHQDFGPFGRDYSKYFLFFQVVKIYGYIIAVASLMIYIIITVRQKTWQSK